MNDNASQRCVLVVEDEMMLAMLVEDILGDAGYRVLKASRVSKALELVEGEERIHAALLDINLAGKQVFPVAEQLRRQGVPFVFASGYGEKGLLEEFRDSPVLQKPYLPAALTRAIAALLV
jgi:CheY-like chemotaxis protein